MYVILVKNACAVALLGKDTMTRMMTDIKFHGKDKMPWANLILALEDSVLAHVATEKTAKDLWERLENIYEGNC